MNFAFSEEQEELRRYVRQWMNQRMPLSRVRELMANPAGYERSDWSAVAEMGWQAMAIPEAYGGAGFGLLELAVLAEEQGRGLFCGPFLSTVVASATTLLEAGSEQQKAQLLPQIAAGELVVAMAVTEEGTGHDGQHMTTSARRSGDDWVIDGTKRFVIDGHSADLLIVAAQTVDGTGLFLVPADADGVTRRRLDTLDETRPQAEIAFDEVVVTDDARLPGSASQAMHRINAVVATMLAVEAVGGAQATLDMAVEYAKDRQQFG
ncbi:MAG: acyl-CoA dehydrogenase family protein, partial [Acidimicrobiia bacterium]|nr:acyl-CoA dehydrogenase family protein [Acidimicrobiia bacterium]